MKLINTVKNLWAKWTIPNLEHKLESATRTLRMLNEMTHVNRSHFVSNGTPIRERIDTQVVYRNHPLIEKYYGKQ